MVDPGSGPFLFDTSAESWLARTRSNWLREYLSLHQLHISAITVLERSRGYSLLYSSAPENRKKKIEGMRVAWLSGLGRVWPLDGAVAVVAGEIMALLPDPPTPPRRSHQLAESRSERLSRWRFDGMIAATALVARLPLIHNNAADFEAIRSAIERSPGRFPDLGPLELIRCRLLRETVH
jgi:predicted nucleic acid-binding protein